MLVEAETDAMRRLPRWARDEIHRLRADLRASEKRALAILGETPTLVEVEPYRCLHGDAARCFLPNHAAVRFTIKSGETIDVHLRDGLLEVRGTGTRSEISVLPRATNLVQIDSIK